MSGLSTLKNVFEFAIAMCVGNLGSLSQEYLLRTEN